MAPSLDFSISSRQQIWRNYEADLLGGFEFMALSDHVICPRKHAVAIVRTICRREIDDDTLSALCHDYISFIRLA